MADYYVQNLIDENIMSMEMFDNILGPVAVLKIRNSRVRVSWCNKQFSMFAGILSVEETLKMNDLGECIFTEDIEKFLSMFELAENTTPRGYICRGRYIRPDARVVVFKANCFYLRYDGEYKYYYVSFTDITEQHFQHLRLQAAMSQNRVNCWDWNIGDNTCTIFSNKEGRGFHPGIDFLDKPETILENFPKSFAEKYEFPADYKESFLHFTEKMYNGVDLSGRSFEFPLVQLDGKIVWLSLTCQNLKDENGNLGHIVGSFTDITYDMDERRQNRYDKHVREALLKQAIYDLTVNVSSNFIVEDNSWEQLTGEAGLMFHTYEDYINKMGNEMLLPEYRDGFFKCFNRQNVIDKFKAGDNETIVYEYQRKYKDGIKWFRMVANSFRMEPDDDYWLYILVYDIDDAKIREQELEKLAATDNMTGLFNRSYTVSAMEKHINAHPMENAAIIFVDLDNFKQVNDNMGHAVGDDILICVAAVFREIFGEDSILGRIGGDEFLLMYYDFELSTLQGKLDDMIDYIHQTCRMLCPDIKVTASVGYIVYPEDGVKLYSLIDKADKALYTVKSKGKNAALRYEKSMDIDDTAIRG